MTHALNFSSILVSNFALFSDIINPCIFNQISVAGRVSHSSLAGTAWRILTGNLHALSWRKRYSGYCSRFGMGCKCISWESERILSGRHVSASERLIVNKLLIAVEHSHLCFVGSLSRTEQSERVDDRIRIRCIAKEIGLVAGKSKRVLTNVAAGIWIIVAESIIMEPGFFIFILTWPAEWTGVRAVVGTYGFSVNSQAAGPDRLSFRIQH